jgi:hypothetical protein
MKRKQMTKIHALAGFFSLLFFSMPPLVEGAEWYVSPSGSASNTGSQNSPWSLQHSLRGANGQVRAGDTVWLRDGVYKDCYFASGLAGTSSAPITFRGYPNERPIIDDGGKMRNPTERCNSALEVESGSWVVFRDFEVMSNVSGSRATSATWPNIPVGINIAANYQTNNLKFINLVIHDMFGHGFGFWVDDTNSEIYGCVVYNNGSNHWDHGIYTQNQNGVKRIVDNIVFQQASHGLHAYTQEGFIDNFHIDGNIAFSNGLLMGGTEAERNYLFGGLNLARNLVFTNNAGYFRANLTRGQNLNLGYSSNGGGCTNAQINGNYLFGGTADFVNCQIASMTGNTFYFKDLGGSVSPASYPSNTWNINNPLQKPTVNKVMVRRNQYENGRANIVIYNWQNLNSVSVDVSQIGLQSGDTYQLRNVQNYFGDILTGTYNGQPISIPMTGRTVATPIGWPQPLSTFPEFGVFVIRKTGSGTPPPPPPPPTSACDVNGNGSVNVTDVQLCANQAVGAASCGSGDINQDGQCTVIDVQRVVNAALGGACVSP